MYKQVVDEIRKNRYTKDTAHEAAKKIYDVSAAGIPVKIIEICKNLGFCVFRQKMPENICGYIAIDGELRGRFPSDRIISVEEGASSKRRRFTVAHELGHFLLDFDPNKTISYTAMEYICPYSQNLPEPEVRANRFAAALLMPEDAFRRDFGAIYAKHADSTERLYDTVQELSDLFLVPPKAVEFRVREELRLL